MGNDLSTNNLRRVGIEQAIEVKNQEDMQLELDRLVFRRVEDKDLTNHNKWTATYLVPLPAYVNKNRVGSCLIHAARKEYLMNGEAIVHYAVTKVNPLGNSRYGSTIQGDCIDVPSSIIVNGMKAHLLLHLKVLIIRFIYVENNPDESLVGLATWRDDDTEGVSPEITFKEFMARVDRDRDGSDGYMYAWHAFRADNASFVMRKLARRFQLSDQAKDALNHMNKVQGYSTQRESRMNIGTKQKKIGASMTLDGDDTVDYDYVLCPNWYKPPPKGSTMQLYDDGGDFIKNTKKISGMTTKEAIEYNKLKKRSKAFKFFGIASRIDTHPTAKHANYSMLAMLR